MKLNKNISIIMLISMVAILRLMLKDVIISSQSVVILLIEIAYHNIQALIIVIAGVQDLLVIQLRKFHLIVIR